MVRAPLSQTWDVKYQLALNHLTKGFWVPQDHTGEDGAAAWLVCDRRGKSELPGVTASRPRRQESNHCAQGWPAVDGELWSAGDAAGGWPRSQLLMSDV